MISGKQIVDALRQRWQNGETQQAIAKVAGISSPHVCELLSGRADAEGLTVRTINKLFPEASLDLQGNSVNIQADFNSGNVVGIKNDTTAADCLSVVMDKILNAEELSDAEKVKVMKVLKK
jgi:predicted transcriptional regulator